MGNNLEQPSPSTQSLGTYNNMILLQINPKSCEPLQVYPCAGVHPKRPIDPAPYHRVPIELRTCIQLLRLRLRLPLRLWLPLQLGLTTGMNLPHNVQAQGARASTSCVN
jgi:hypothetical protein